MRRLLGLVLAAFVLTVVAPVVEAATQTPQMVNVVRKQRRVKRYKAKKHPKAKWGTRRR